MNKKGDKNINKKAWLVEELINIKVRPIKVTNIDEDGWVNFIYEDTGESDVIEKEEICWDKEQVLERVSRLI